MLILNCQRIGRLFLQHVQSSSGLRCFVRTGAIKCGCTLTEVCRCMGKSFWIMGSFQRNSTSSRPWHALRMIIPVRMMRMFSPAKQYKARHKEDKVHSDYSLIYHNNMWKYYQYATPVCMLLATPVLGLDLFLVYRYFTNPSTSFEVKVGDNIILSNSKVYVCVATVFMVVLMISVQKLWRMYMARLYYNSKTNHYIGICPKMLYGNKQIHFSLNDVRMSKNSNNSMFRGNLNIKGRSFLVNENDFVEMNYFNRLVGYIPEKAPQLTIPDLTQIAQKLKAKNKGKRK